MLSVIVPVYNDGDTLDEVVQGLTRMDALHEILIVDDGSTDGTGDKIRQLQDQPRVRALVHDRNRGKGAAIRTALAHVTGEVVIIQDADLEYDPADIPRVISPILEGRAEVVYGSRFLRNDRQDCLPGRRTANRFVTWLSNRFTGLRLSDMETCYKAFRREVLEKVQLRAERFGFEPEFTAKVARHHFRVYEVPISYSGRTYEEGKKITWRDGVRALGAIVWFRFFD